MITSCIISYDCPSPPPFIKVKVKVKVVVGLRSGKRLLPSRSTCHRYWEWVGAGVHPWKGSLELPRRRTRSGSDQIIISEMTWGQEAMEVEVEAEA